MKHALRSVLVLFLFTASSFILQDAVAGSKKINPKQVLTDTIPIFTLDTTNYLTLPLVVRQDTVPVEPDELIKDRLACLQREIPLHFNAYVRAHIDYFTIRNRKYSRRVLERQNVYFPLFEKYLAQYNLPEEFKYLAVVESALLPRAVSSAKAVGLWQFMTPTANDFRLKQNEYVDERMDPEKATIAACKFLNQLYRIFGDWEMVMAAYNCGPGNVKKAIARAGGGKKTFWQIFPYLPKETRGYVPSFTAITYMMNHSREHEIFPDTLLFPVQTDTILINQSLDLERLALQLELSKDEITKLNPEIRKAMLPETIRNYPLKVPAQKREILAMNRAAILDSSRIPVYVAPTPPIMLASANLLKKNATPDSAATDSLQLTEYIVQKGDFLERIAQKHQVSIAQIKGWNHLRNNTVVPGQKLTLIIAAQPEEPAAKEAATETIAEAKKPATQLASANTTRQEARKKQIEQEVRLIHAVQQGDTLWNISKRYNNIPVEKIKKLNKLKTDEIKPGQKLVIS
ncbi:MAG: LysM peptidoglycan-binding domain-containing protein [Adhaeribacter sp.]